jgi:hypothetical protein
MDQMTINHAYPWGRSFDEYRRMFGLTDEELELRILGCADGPASFNAEMHRLGRRVVSCDPLYAFSADEIRGRIGATAAKLVADARATAGRYIWDRIRSPEELGRVRMATMERFLTDYDDGRCDGRYLPYSLPTLDFPDDSFAMALCSHFLLLYSSELSREFHVRAALEMCRVARQVRIFPLLDMEGRISQHLEALTRELTIGGFDAQVRTVDYEFQRGGNQMLRITRNRGAQWTT